MWAAGPITAVALSIGYYFAYGKLVPLTTVIYFSSYAFFVGTGAFLTKVFLDARDFKKREEMLETFLDVVDDSYKKIYQARRARLDLLDDELQREEMVSYLLSKSHPTNREIHYAFSIYFDEEIANFAENVWIHDNNSLPIDNDENREMLTHCYKEIDKNEEMSQDLKQQFFSALQADYPSLNDGIERKVGFLSKIYTSAGKHRLFDLEDARHAIQLFVELLSGRNIFYYEIEPKFNNAKKDYIFKSIEEVRYKIYQRHNILYGIHNQCYVLASEIEDELTLKSIVNIRRDVVLNVNRIKKSLALLDVSSISKENARMYRDLRNKFLQNISSLRGLLKKFEQLNRRWKYIQQDDSQKDISYDDIDISLEMIRLERKDGIAIAAEMAEYIEAEHEFDSNRQMVKAYAIKAVSMLSKYISLDDPAIIAAIEVSKGANLTSIELYDSAKQKLETTANLCKAVDSRKKELKAKIKKIVISQYLEV